jgi:transcriptional regulator with XRE-family HTH domain
MIVPDSQIAIGRRLKEVRESLGKSQQQMASAIGASFSAYRAYEAGERPMRGDHLERIGLLGFNLNWLILGAGSVLQGPPPIELQTNEARWSGHAGVRVDERHLFPGACTVLQHGAITTRADLVPEVMATALPLALPFIDRARSQDDAELWRAAASTLIGSYNLSFWEWFRSREKSGLISTSGKTGGG